MNIIPSILEYTKSDFESLLTSLSLLSKHLHIDIVDESVGTPTITINEIIDILASPSTQNNTIEIHLMVADPATLIEQINSSGLPVTKIYVHIGQQHLIQNHNYKNVCFYISPEDEIDTIASSSSIQRRFRIG